MSLHGSKQAGHLKMMKQDRLYFLNRALIITGECACGQSAQREWARGGVQRNWRCLYFFVVKPFYQRSWDGDKGSADDFLNGEIAWNPRPCLCCLLPVMQPHSLPPSSRPLPRTPTRTLPLARGWKCYAVMLKPSAWPLLICIMCVINVCYQCHCHNSSAWNSRRMAAAKILVDVHI